MSIVTARPIEIPTDSQCRFHVDHFASVTGTLTVRYASSPKAPAPQSSHRDSDTPASRPSWTSTGTSMKASPVTPPTPPTYPGTHLGTVRYSVQLPLALLVLGWEDAAFERDGEGVECCFPSVHPAFPSTPCWVQTTHHEVETLQRGLFGREVTSCSDRGSPRHLCRRFLLSLTAALCRPRDETRRMHPPHLISTERLGSHSNERTFQKGRHRPLNVGLACPICRCRSDPLCLGRRQWTLPARRRQ